jgi:TonB family protein
MASGESCPADRDATVTSAVPPDYPSGARLLGPGPKTVLVDVTVSPAGNVTAVRIQESSGNGLLDVAAMEAALKSTYRAKIIACKGVEGHYLFRAEFNPA